MNQSRASRYHRARRRLSAAALLLAGGLLALLLATSASAALREVVGGSAAAYGLMLAAGLEASILPLSWIRVRVVERRAGLPVMPPGAWWRLSLLRIGITAALAAGAAELLYAFIRAWPAWWWVPAAASGALLVAVATLVAPMLILPLFDRPRPLRRGALGERLSALAQRIGIGDLVVQEWGASDPRSRTSATLVGVGASPRVLLSADLVEDFTEEEIEVILAHELAHHVHRDLLRALGAEVVVLTAALGVSAWVLGVAWMRVGLASPADPAGLPLILLVAGGLRTAAAPVLNALSRRAERQADRFALEVVTRPGAFTGAVRRMAARNLAEEHPTRAAFWLFHTHPTVEQRIAEARASRVDGDRDEAE